MGAGYNFTTYGKSTETCRIEELQTRKALSSIRPLAQYIGSDKRRVLRPCVPYVWHRGPKPATCRFWLFCWIIFYTASDSKCFLQNQNISFL